MQRRTQIGVIGGAVCCVILAAIGVTAAAEFEVTVTNLTRGQVFTPILVASHQEGVRRGGLCAHPRGYPRHR